MAIGRPAPIARVRESFAVHPVVALTGPRQCGKTTLARAIAAEAAGSTYFDLEAAVARRRLDVPEHTLGRLSGLVVLDEVQRLPDLFETIRVLVDRPDNGARFLLLGSASPALVKGVSIMDRSGTGRNWRGRSARMSGQRAGIWIFWLGRSWSGCYPRGSRT